MCSRIKEFRRVKYQSVTNELKSTILFLAFLALIILSIGWIAGFTAGYRPPEALDKCEVMVTKEETLVAGRQLFYVCPKPPLATSTPSVATTTQATTTPIKETKSETL